MENTEFLTWKLRLRYLLPLLGWINDIMQKTCLAQGPGSWWTWEIEAAVNTAAAATVRIIVITSICAHYYSDHLSKADTPPPRGGEDFQLLAPHLHKWDHLSLPFLSSKLVAQIVFRGVGEIRRNPGQLRQEKPTGGSGVKWLSDPEWAPPQHPLLSAFSHRSQVFMDRPCFLY